MAPPPLCLPLPRIRGGGGGDGDCSGDGDGDRRGGDQGNKNAVKEEGDGAEDRMLQRSCSKDGPGETEEAQAAGRGHGHGQEDVVVFKKVFDAFDVNRDGVITVEELCEWTQRLGLDISEDGVRDMVVKALGHDRLMGVDEFRAFNRALQCGKAWIPEQSGSASTSVSAEATCRDVGHPDDEERISRAGGGHGDKHHSRSSDDGIKRPHIHGTESVASGDGGGDGGGDGATKRPHIHGTESVASGDGDGDGGIKIRPHIHAGKEVVASGDGDGYGDIKIRSHIHVGKEGVASGDGDGDGDDATKRPHIHAGNEGVASGDGDDDAILKRPDIHGNEGVVSGDAAAAAAADESDDGEIREAFRVFDKNGDGLISASDLRSTLSDFGLVSASTSFRRINSMIRRADTDLDGFVSLPEFKSMIKDDN